MAQIGLGPARHCIASEVSGAVDRIARDMNALRPRLVELQRSQSEYQMRVMTPLKNAAKSI